MLAIVIKSIESALTLLPKVAQHAGEQALTVLNKVEAARLKSLEPPKAERKKPNIVRVVQPEPTPEPPPVPEEEEKKEGASYEEDDDFNDVSKFDLEIFQKLFKRTKTTANIFIRKGEQQAGGGGPSKPGEGINKKAFRKVVRELLDVDDSVSDESIDKVFAAIDTDGKGTITQGELTSAVNRRPSTAERRGSTKEDGAGNKPAALTRGESSASMPAKLKRGESASEQGSPPKR